MIHPDTYVKDTPKGLGLFAKRPFRRGEILWIIDDVDARIPLAEYEALSDFQRNKINIYCYLDYLNRVIVPWDEGKYVNHSCDPNSTGLLEFDNLSIALRDIAQDEEIVEDYYCYYGHFETFTCRCGSSNCRNLIAQEASFDPGLRIPLEEIAPLILSLPQPLLAVVSVENRALFERLDAFRQPVEVHLNGKLKT